MWVETIVLARRDSAPPGAHDQENYYLDSIRLYEVIVAVVVAAVVVAVVVVVVVVVLVLALVLL